MKILTDPDVHLTYCLNVHPGESWAECLAAIRDKATRVRRLVGRPGPFGLGLRLSCQAARELAAPGQIEEFRAFLAAAGLYVFTINGFPYGAFHSAPLKQDVYAPDWRTTDRRAYTMLLAKILAQLLPEGVEGSISTVPGSYKEWIQTETDVEEMVQSLADAAGKLHHLAEQTGRHVTLALEPEPDCFIETTEEAVEFLTGPPGDLALDYLRKKYNFSDSAAEHAWREHIGVCFDTAHAAVQFEDPAESVNYLKANGVKVGKVQVSSALRVQPTEAALQRLQEFAEGVYLHQVKVFTAERKILSYPDLPAAMEHAPAEASPGSEWRVHFHVPLFWEGSDGLESTSSLLTPELFDNTVDAGCGQLEIETYTFGVLPRTMRTMDVTESIAREYQWVLARTAEQWMRRT